MRAAEIALATDGLASNRCGSSSGLLRMLVTLDVGPADLFGNVAIKVLGGDNVDRHSRLRQRPAPRARLTDRARQEASSHQASDKVLKMRAEML